MQEMAELMKNPKEMKDWFESKQKLFESLPEDQFQGSIRLYQHQESYFLPIQLADLFKVHLTWYSLRLKVD